LRAKSIAQDMARLQVLVDKAALVGFAQTPGGADRETQKATHLHWPIEQPGKRFAAGILEHQ
jgi:hypothetical protein